MASFKERYEELFGDTPDYDPISLEDDYAGRGRRRALNIQDAAPEIDAAGGIPWRSRERAIEPDQGVLGNLADLTKTGTAMFGEAALGVGEYAARQASRTEIGPVSEAFTGIAGALEGTRGKLAAYRQSVYDMMPPEAIEMKGAEFLTLDPDKTIWKGNPLEVGEAVLYKFWESLPMMVGTIIPGAVMLRAGATAKGLTYLGASEGGLSVGFIANDITDGIQEMDDETLAKESPRFAELLETVGSPEAARNQLITEAQGLAPLIGGVLVGAISATAGRYLEPVLTGKAGLGAGQRATRGAISEGVFQEGPQESVEQMAQNIAAAVFDGDRAALEGVAEAFVQGAVVGTPAGAAVGALGGQAAEPIAPSATPTDRDQPDAPSSFRDVFGEQVPPPGGYTGAPGEMFGDRGIEVTDEAVAADAAAAVSAAIRDEGLMDDMINNADMDPSQQGLVMPGGGMNAQGTDVATVIPQPTTIEGQGELPLVQRQRGVPPQPVPGAPDERDIVPTQLPPQDGEPAVEGVPDLGTTVPTEQQADLFEQVPVGQPDQPSAEPMGDIMAQLADLESEKTTREGVYISADSLARLQEDGLREQLGEYGTHLVNFDGKGGLLIVRDEMVAESVQDLKSGGFPMQFILGQVTRAGDGKPAGDTVVQVRDETGAVIRETITATEDEAFALAEEIGESAVVLTTQQAIKRREQLIAKERDELQTVRQEREAGKKATAAIEQELLPDEQFEAETAVAGAKTPSKAAARLLGLATKKGAVEKAQSIKGFFAPKSLVFDSTAIAANYKRVWDRLVENQLKFAEIDAGVATHKSLRRKAALGKKEDSLLSELGKIRQLGKPTRSTTRVVKAAAKTDVSTVTTQAQEASRRAQDIDTSQQDYFAGEQFKVMTRDQIDNLEGEELTTAFGSAAYWLAGQFRNVEITPEWLADNPEAAEQEVAETIANAKGDPLKALAEQYSTPGQQKKLLRRASVIFQRRKYGGKVAARGVTAKAKGERTTVTEFDTGVLTRDTQKQDESRADQIKREARSKKARKELETAVRQSTKFIMRLESPRSAFGKLVAEKDVDGKETQEASNLRVAKAYYVALNEFALSLIQSGQTTNDANQVMERLNKRLRDLAKLKPKTFANQVARMARADEQSSLLTIAHPEVRQQVTDPAKRAATIAKYFDELLGNLQRRARMHDVWQKNAFYNNLVGPLMSRFVDSIAVDGWASYKPNEAEVEYLQHAMRGWREAGGNTKKELYDPLKRFFRGVGITFDEQGDVVVQRDEKGKFQYSPTDEALNKLLTKKIGTETETGYAARFVASQTIDQFNAERTADPATGLTPAEQRRQTSAKIADAKVDNEQLGILKAANKAINALLKIVNNHKSTITKLATAEQNFIRKLKQLGVWQDTGSPIIGRIVVGVPKRYHRVALRLLQKKITKQEARGIMGKIKPFPMPRGLEQQTFTATQAEKELDLLSTLVASSVNEPALLETAAAIGVNLSNRDIAPSMNGVLRTILDTLPENHMYRRLAEKLLALNIDDVTVQYDWDGSVFEGDKDLGKFRVRKDTGRKIYLNRSVLRQERDVGSDLSPNAVHTVLHEMVHAATHRALRTNSQLNYDVTRLREYVKENYTGERQYGLDEGKNANDEFIAEAMSNPEFQQVLKNIYLDGRTVWRRLTNLVRKVLGLEDSVPVSVMDVIMSLESELFAGSRLQTKAEADVDLDMAVRPLVSAAVDRLNTGVGSMKRVWDSIRPPLIAMSMEQIRDTYQQNFGGVTGPLTGYMKAFFARNAENTRLMERAERLTRRWTALNEESGAETGIEFSEVATDATLHKVAADQPLSHKANEHIKSDAHKKRHRELHNRFKLLPAGYKKLYGDLQTFYRETLENESALMTFNALRGLLVGTEMTAKEFETKYSLDSIKKLDTAEKFNAEFGQYLDKDMVGTLHQMANVRQHREGNYFPLKRYGDYVVFAEKEIGRKVFAESKDAYAYAAERRATDVTLTVDVKEQDDGTFRVKIVEKDFRTAETRTKAEQNREDMIEQYGEGVPSPVQLKSQQSQKAAIESNAQLNSILNSLKGNTAAQAAIKSFYLDSLAESSFRKHEMTRKNRRGVETDLQLRNFTVYAKQSSYYTAQLMFGSKMAEGMAQMDKFIRAHRDEADISSVRLGEIYREIKKRDEMTTDLNEIANYAKKSVELTQFMMLTSPSYWMINASQPWMVTLPWLNAKYGLGASLSAMKNAQKLIISPLLNAAGETKGGLSALVSKVKAEKAFNVLDDVLIQIKARDPANYEQYREMLEELRQQGVIDLSWIAELRDISEGTETGKWQKTLDASRVMAHLTEVNNRILTALATYELAKAAAIRVKIDPATAHLVGIKEAKLSVSQTQFNYSSPNKPRLFQQGGPMGNFGPMMFQFMQWPQHMYALMISNMHRMVKGGDIERKEARKLLTGLFGTHLVAGGILGAALQPVKWAIGLTAMAFGDEGDDTFKGAVSGEIFDRYTTKLVTDMFGSEIGGVLAKGLPTVVGADLSQRMSLGTVYYLNFRGNNAESALGSLALGLGGASVNLAANFGRGVQHMFEGNYLRAIEGASPKILRDVVRTGRYWSEGLVNNAGDTVIDAEGVGARDLVLQAFGISPYSISRYYEGQSAIKDKEIYFRERKSDILKDFRLAKTPSDRAAVMRQVSEFNRRNPAIAITRSALIQSVKGKAERESRYRRYGANIDEKAATQFAQEGDPYR